MRFPWVEAYATGYIFGTCLEIISVIVRKIRYESDFYFKKNEMYVVYIERNFDMINFRPSKFYRVF